MLLCANTEGKLATSLDFTTMHWLSRLCLFHIMSCIILSHPVLSRPVSYYLEIILHAILTVLYVMGPQLHKPILAVITYIVTCVVDVYNTFC